ncbi:hypothetical protein PMAYCL1PPCAC_05787, partial [Pristionchus mayeri]
MNTTELSSQFQSAVSMAHHICGPVFLSINTFVCLLIVLDTDAQGKVYRKYLFSLQFFSTLTDAFLSTQAPVMQMNCRLMYSESEIGNFIDTESATMIYVILFFGVSYAYFTCVYYRQ